MNKGSSTPKRVMGRPQPKRPKLDFSARSSSYPSPKKLKDSNCITKNSSNSNAEIQKVQCVASAPDWDDEDDFPSDMLEKVCEIADLSQAMVNNEPKVKETTDESQHGLKRTVSVREDAENGSKLFDDLERLRLDNEKLMENIKIKEGEVQILRSQLKQNQEAKQAETLNNIRLMKELENSYKDKLEATQKDFAAAKTELQFKDLELKSLTERCQQLESSTSKVRLVEPQMTQLDCKKTLFNSKSRSKDVEMDDSNICNKEEPISFDFPVLQIHEGQKFGTLLCPEYFNCAEEPSIISLYKFRSGCGFHVSSMDFDKREKYIWSGLPKQSVFIKDTYDSVSRLFLYDNFNEKSAKDIIENLLDVSVEILNFQRELLEFLEKLQEKNSKHDDSDCTLLENEEEVSMITVKHLLGGNKIGSEECALESRRVLAMIVSLTISAKSVLRMVVDKPGFITLLKDLVVSVGNLRKPTRYTGILAGVTLLLTRLLEENTLNQEMLSVLNVITEEIIFARPKLDVLTLVVEALAVAKKHANFVQELCRKGSVESCALYMDSRLHQAMFFTKDACPLKLLCTQIMGLSCIPASREMRLNVTRSVTKWLNRIMDAPFSQDIKWIPTASFVEGEEKCFDVMECFVYLLNCCLKDYFLISNFRDEVSDRKRSDILSVIGDGCLLFRRILKSDQRLLHENSHNLRFATLLSNLSDHNGLRTDQKEVVTWVIQLLKNHECCAKQTLCGVPKSPTGDSDSYEDVINSLKMSDDLIIF